MHCFTVVAPSTEIDETSTNEKARCLEKVFPRSVWRVPSQQQSKVLFSQRKAFWQLIYRINAQDFNFRQSIHSDLNSLGRLVSLPLLSCEFS